MSLKHLFYIVFFVLSCSAWSQSTYIYNPDFEAMDGVPDTQGDVNDLHSWECRTNLVNTNYFHSPDVYTATYSPLLNFNVTPPPTPHSGSNMVGMLPYELIQQRFNNQAMEPGEFYTVSMYIWLANNDPNWWQNHEVRVFLSKNKTKYKDEDNQLCSNDYTTYDLNASEKTNIGGTTLNLTKYPTGEWHRVSFTFKAPNDIKTAWDWIVIDMARPNYSDASCGGQYPCSSCFGGYMFIDDINLNKADFCNAICSPPKFIQGNITFPNPIPNAMVASCTPWCFTVQNAIGIDLEVYDSNGHLIYQQHAFDVNVLKDVGYNDYFFGWLGQLPSGNYLPVDVFVYRLHIWNCYHDFLQTSTFTNAGGSCSGTVQGYDIMNNELNDCCPRIVYKQNIIYSPSIIYPKTGADEYIYAGSNVLSSSPPGPVIVQSGVTVKYIAGINVNLEPGFVALPGSHFSAETEPCAYAQRLGHTDRRSGFFSSKTNATGNYTSGSIKLYPNPSSGDFSYTVLDEESTPNSITVENINGMEIANIKLTNNKIDLSYLPNGVYIICFLKNNSVIERTKVIITKQ